MTWSFTGLHILGVLQFGEENTKFFHATATIRYRTNQIVILKAPDGQEVTNHHGKASLLWEAYKDRLGTTEKPTMHFQLQELLQQHDDLKFLEEPFSHEEIDEVIKHLPSDKSPGQDGFNGDFLKKY